MALSELSFVAVFMTGLLGGVHCAGMCGGIVSALGMQTQKPLRHALDIPVVMQSTGGAASFTQGSPAVTSTGSTILRVAGYNLGRLLTYTLLGALAGGVGSMAWLMQSMLPIQQTAYAISNVLLILMGLYVLGVKRIGTAVESLGKTLWHRVRPHATARLRGSGWVNSISTGALWGLVPCGMVYAVLTAALVSGNALHGALLMLAFGAGTLPNLMALGLSGQWLAKASKQQFVRWGAGALIILFGISGLLHLGMMAHGPHGAM